MAYQKGGVLASGIVMYFFSSKSIAFKKICKHLKLSQCCKLAILHFLNGLKIITNRKKINCFQENMQTLEDNVVN